ncbi:MAG: phospho-N-acetylmuramoyl-pentapeptide-transferase [Bulleidia sp.]
MGNILTTIGSFLVSWGLVLAFMPKLIEYLKKLSLKQTVSEYALDDDRKKAGTPIMGGILFIVVPVLISIIFNITSLHDFRYWIVILSFVGYGLIGFVDDYLIAIRKNNDGLTPGKKFMMQVILAGIVFLLYPKSDLSIAIPFTDITLQTGWGYALLVLFMFAGSSNAVNLTDGMDGLSAGVTWIALIPFLIIATIQKEYNLVTLIACLLGALLGYLHYNKKPAKVFMGDTGSLALGGILAALAMVMKKELALIFIAGIPVIETLCVLIQQISVRTFHRRVFIYTPIHYAFRIKGMPEVNIVRMFWIVEAVLAAFGLFVALH